MNRREFTAAGLTGLGVVALSGAAAQAGVPLSTLAGSNASVGAAGVGASSTASAAAVGSAGAWEILDATAPSAADLARAARSEVFAGLLSPLAVGSSLAGFAVQGARIDDYGVGVVTLSSGAGEFVLNVFRRSEGVAVVASTSSYAVVVRNGGTGDVPTPESQASAALALAEVIASNEGSAASPELVSVSAFWSHSQV
jgi:hypothetical protein